MPNWIRKGTSFTCSDCKVTFPAGQSCGCSGDSPTTAAEPDASQSSAAAEVGLSTAEVRRWLRNWLVRMDRIDQGLYESKNGRARSKWTARSKHHAEWLKGLRFAHELAAAVEEAAETARLEALAEQLEERDGVQREGVH